MNPGVFTATREDGDNIWYTCRLCHEVFPKKQELRIHRRTTHREELLRQLQSKRRGPAATDNGHVDEMKKRVMEIFFTRQANIITMKEKMESVVDSGMETEVLDFSRSPAATNETKPMIQSGPQIFPNAAAALRELLGGSTSPTKKWRISSDSNIGWKYQKKFRLDIVPSFSLTGNQAKRAYEKVQILPPPPPSQLPPQKEPVPLAIKNLYEFKNEQKPNSCPSTENFVEAKIPTMQIQDGGLHCVCVICDEAFDKITDVLTHTTKWHQEYMAKCEKKSDLFIEKNGKETDQKFNSKFLSKSLVKNNSKSSLKFELVSSKPPIIDQNGGGQCMGCDSCDSQIQIQIEAPKGLQPFDQEPVSNFEKSGPSPPQHVQKRASKKLNKNPKIKKRRPKSASNQEKPPKHIELSPMTAALNEMSRQERILRKNFKKHRYAGKCVHVCKICCNVFDTMQLACSHFKVHEDEGSEKIVTNFVTVANDIVRNHGVPKDIVVPSQSRKLMMKREIVEASSNMDQEMADFLNFEPPEDSVDSDDASVAEVYDEEDEKDKIYCECKQTAFGRMVMCDNRKCSTQWFHYDCVGLMNKPKGRWYCPHCPVVAKM